MERVLWLRFERAPHPDAVCHAADEQDARLVVELLSRPRLERVYVAARLRNYLARQEALPPLSRAAVPVRRCDGIFRLVPWRLAKWLSCVLPATDGVLERTRSRVESWLANDARPIAVAPDSEAARKILLTTRNHVGNS